MDPPYSIHAEVSSRSSANFQMSLLNMASFSSGAIWYYIRASQEIET